MSGGGAFDDRRRFTSGALGLSYEVPLHIVRGQGAYLYDATGRRFLDCVNNVCHVGHCHPRVVDAAHRQMGELNTNTRYLHDNLPAYASRLSDSMPEGLDVCFFVNSGSEANDLALRLARINTGRKDVCVVDGAYHGNLGSLIEISPYKFNGPGGDGQPAHVRVAPTPDTYRGEFKVTDPHAADEFAKSVGRLSDGTSCFICESLPGCAGQIVPPVGYLASAFDLARAAGAVAIVDEVQVGFGRVGEHMWGFGAQGAVPDIVSLGKPIGNGHPMGAVVTTRAIADAFANGMEYFNTFGGNPVSCAVGLAVLDVIEEEGLQRHAKEVGALLIEALNSLQNKYEIIGDVRGMGLFIGVELVRDRDTLEPAAREATSIINAMKDRGVLLSTDGPHHNVIKIKPPLVFSRTDADELVAGLDAVIGAMPASP